MFEGVLCSTIALELLFGWIFSPSELDFEWFLSLQNLFFESRIAFGETCMKRFRLKNLLWWLGRLGADQWMDHSIDQSIDRAINRLSNWAIDQSSNRLSLIEHRQARMQRDWRLLQHQNESHRTRSTPPHCSCTCYSIGIFAIVVVSVVCVVAIIVVGFQTLTTLL